MNVPNREAVELNSRGQRPRLARQPRPTLEGSDSLLSDPSRVAFIRRLVSGGVATGY
jgi:hypothetical protein